VVLLQLLLLFFWLIFDVCLMGFGECGLVSQYYLMFLLCGICGLLQFIVLEIVDC
jgi:hypothetical protein